MSGPSGRSFLAIDWGTTNRRIYLVVDGKVVRSQRDGRGVKQMPPGGFACEIDAIRREFGDLPMLLAGMVGSTAGWQVAPYAQAPAGIDDLAARLAFVDRRTAIVPGVSVVAAGRGDVMRGEEVQLLGAVAAGLAPADALMCQPGTHCKWATMAGGRIVGFATAMTGELFGLLGRDSLIAPLLGGEVTAGDAFAAGVRDGAAGDLPARLFGIRADSLLGLRDDRDAASYASGLLIGADVQPRIAEATGTSVHLLADPALGTLYATAIGLLGGQAVAVDSQAAFVAGIDAIGRMTW